MIEWVADLGTRMLAGLLWPIHEFFQDGNSRYFWLYCLTGIAMAAFVNSRPHSYGPTEKPLFSREVWLSQSAINDYYIVVIGNILKLTLLSWAFIHWRPIADAVVSLLRSVGVTGTQHDGSAIMLGLALTVSLFLVDDFLRWYLHYLLHKIPELWEFHKVHHSAEVLNFATSERIHPLEIVFSSFCAAIALGIVNGLFIAFFGDQLTVQTVFGANALLFVFNVLGGVLRHSPVWISFGPAVERWVISPAMHQIHHSNDPRHYNKNMGGSLSVWDRVFGTIHIPNGREVEGFGIGEETPDFRSLGVIYFRPFVQAGEHFANRISRIAAKRVPPKPAHLA